MKLGDLLRILFNIGLVLCLVNLSVQCWSSGIFIAEINEEIVHVLEDETPAETSSLDNKTPNSIPIFSYELSNANATLCDYAARHYFEIDSPPPELG